MEPWNHILDGDRESSVDRQGETKDGCRSESLLLSDISSPKCGATIPYLGKGTGQSANTPEVHRHGQGAGEREKQENKEVTGSTSQVRHEVKHQIEGD